MDDYFQKRRDREDISAMTVKELKSWLEEIEDRINFGQEAGAEEWFINLLRHDARAVRTELGRRTDDPNFTSDYRDPSSEVKFEREVNLGDLQARAIERGELVVSFLPVLGRDKFIVKGWSHILAAYPKTGKTELIVRLIAEWPEEKILYFTEEPESVWEARLLNLPTLYQHVKLFIGLGVSSSEILARITASDETVVILETVRNLLGLRDEKDNSEVARALIPFIATSRKKGQTLITLHHDRKGGGEHGEAIAGGHAFLGIIDRALELKRDSANESRRLLSGLGRVFVTADLMYELRPDNTIVGLGSPQLVTLQEVKARLSTVLEDDWKKTSELIDAIGEPKPSNDQAVKALEELAKNGVMERDPPIDQGKKQGKTYKWRRAQNLTSDGPPYRSEVKLANPNLSGEHTEWTLEL